MATYTADNAECTVFTFKEGLLSKMAHDLKIRATGFRIDVDDESKAIHATVDARSLSVVCSMKDGKEADALSDKDKGEIEKNIVKDVLHASKFPEITFTSRAVKPTDDGYELTGVLALHGKEQPITTTATRDGDRLVVEISIHQPDFGIKPFSAVLGTLKVKPDVTLRLSVPA